jgi:hypothetical protein
MSIGPVIHLASDNIQSLFTGAVSGSTSSNTASTSTAAVRNNQDTRSVSASKTNDPGWLPR